MTPMDNLSQPAKERSSAQPVVGGESRNAPYGPRTAVEVDISTLQRESDTFDHSQSGFRVGRTSGPSQAGMGESSLKPQ